MITAIPSVLTNIGLLEADKVSSHSEHFFVASTDCSTFGVQRHNFWQGNKLLHLCLDAQSEWSLEYLMVPCVGAAALPDQQAPPSAEAFVAPAVAAARLSYEWMNMAVFGCLAGA